MQTRSISIAFGFLLFHSLVSLGKFPSIWGADTLLYGFGNQVLFWIGSGVIALYAVWPDAIFPALGRLTRGPYVIPSAGVVLFAALSTSTHLLGDGYLYLRELDNETWAEVSRQDRAPLIFWVLPHLHSVLSGFGLNALAIYRGLSLASGLAYVILSLRVGSFLTDDTTSRNTIAAFLLSAGYLQLFCGYVENYALLYPGMLVFIASLARTIRQGAPLLFGSLTLAVLTTLHFSAAFLTPALLVASWHCRKSGGLQSSVAGLLVYPIATGLILWAIDFNFAALASSAVSQALPLWGAPTYSSAYALLSFVHLGDILNVLLLSSPLALVILPTLSFRQLCSDPIGILLLSFSGGALLFLLIANPEVGAFRDWDVLSLPALPLLVLTAYAWSAQNPTARSVVIVVSAAGLHTLLWIHLNADPAAAVARYETLLEKSPISTHGKVYGWETVGSYLREQNDTAGTIRAYEHALRANPNHERLWVLLGNARLQGNLLDGAADAYTKAIQLNPQNSGAHSNLGVIHVRQGQYVEALSQLDEAIRLDAGSAEAHMNRGVALANQGRRDEAISSLRHAITLDPDYRNTYDNLSTLYLQAGRPDSARYFQSFAH